MSSIFKSTFETMISGRMSDEDICFYLEKWEKRGIDAEELEDAARILRFRMIPVKAPEGAMDIVGTGGDGLKTYNISTAAAFVVAGAGVPVAKHGNRAVSSKSGASDVLSELGVKLDIPPAQTEVCIVEAGIGFLFAPSHHKAMGSVAAARAKLGTRTIFNRLGPLCNPASVRHYLLGVYADDLREIFAQALAGLGVKRALIVRGCDGMDEITTTRATMVTEVSGKTITNTRITPERLGLTRVNLADLEGGDAKHNAAALKDVLYGAQNAYADAAALNAGAALYVANKAKTIQDGIALARQSIGSGAAVKALNDLVEVSNRVEVSNG
ncbi:MAG: anthranilate phosphoribosyltransferase [Robiginitomaculum sp.]|nr:anthranilate phosphoribosyltransferase [Robiginitomaculum sp.]